MTLKEAYEIAKNIYRSDKEIPYLVSCIDFGEFWGFGFSSIPCEKGGVCYGYDTVSKVDGKVDVFNPWSDKNGVELMNNAVKIPLDEVLKEACKL